MKFVRPSMNLDDILTREKWSPGDMIVLRDGAYTSQGSQFGGVCAIPAGVTLDASAAKIALVDPVLGEQPWIEFPLVSAGAKIVGGDWDLGNHGGIAQSGFRALGTASVIGAKVIGLLGRRKATADHPVKEVFAFCQPDGGAGGTRIENLVATVLSDTPDNYASGVYTNDQGSNVVKCDMRLGQCGQFAYSCTRETEFVDCRGEAARFGYTDTGAFRGTFRRCAGRAHWAAWSFAGSGGVWAPSRDLIAIDCDIDASGGRVVEFDDSHGAQRATVILTGGSHLGAYRIASNSPTSRMYAIGATIRAPMDYRPNGEPEPIIA